jgi:uncharacterized protein (UPF0335 family)
MKTLGIIEENLSKQLEKYLMRIEALEQEKADIANSMKETLQEAKGEGVDIRALKELVKLRKMERAEVEEQRSILHSYMQAVGMHKN